jgi:charged multivesicular body protein 4
VEEIGEAITQSVPGVGIDEADLEAELEDLQQEVMDERMLSSGQVPVADKVSPTLPNAPTAGLYSPSPLSLVLTCGAVKKTPVQAEDDEEEEIRKLQAEMGM